MRCSMTPTPSARWAGRGEADRGAGTRSTVTTPQMVKSTRKRGTLAWGWKRQDDGECPSPGIPGSRVG